MNIIKPIIVAALVLAFAPDPAMAEKGALGEFGGWKAKRFGIHEGLVYYSLQSVVFEIIGDKSKTIEEINTIIRANRIPDFIKQQCFKSWGIFGAEFMFVEENEEFDKPAFASYYKCTERK